MAPPLALSRQHPSPYPRQAGLWLRNIQLGMFALPLAAACMAYQDCAVYAPYMHCACALH